LAAQTRYHSISRVFNPQNASSSYHSNSHSISPIFEPYNAPERVSDYIQQSQSFATHFDAF
jgi:hypothetical protein